MLNLCRVLDFPERLDDVPGNNGELAVFECMDAIRSSVRSGQKLILFQGATGCGKSKVLPEQYARMLAELADFDGKLLVLTTAAKDVESMHNYCKNTASHYRTGGGQKGGCEWKDAQIIFATVGLFVRWYASYGVNLLDEFGAVLLDEIGSVERQVDYSFVYQVMRQKQQRGGKFKILMCTATMSERLSNSLAELNPHMIQCSKRPYVLERYVKAFDTLDIMYKKVAESGQELVNTGRTGLIFLPGEAEITKVTDMLISLGVATEKIFPLFSDLDPKRIKAALTASPTARLVLATSIAELALTIPDVDVVLDTGVGRWTSTDEVPTSIDYLISPTTIEQREGRAGRTKSGCYVRFLCQDLVPLDAGLDRLSW